MTINLTITSNSASTQTVTACDSYLWNGISYTASGNYSDTIPNEAGCDSIVTLHLTINAADISVTQTVTGLTSVASNASYQWLNCDNEYIPLVGQNNQSLAAETKGNYAVVVTQNNCTDTSLCFNIIPTNFSPLVYSNEITIYPNPSNGYFKIKLPEISSQGDITVSDLCGKEVYSETFIRTNALNLHLNVQSGIYLVIINSGGKKAVIKLIKE